MKKILLSACVAIALLTGCGEEKKVVETKPVVETKMEVVKKVEAIKTPEAKLVEQVKESTSEVATKIVEESKKVAAIGSEAIKSVSEKVVAKTQEVTKVVAKKAVETKDKIEESINTIVATKTEATKSESADSAKGKGLYLKCAGCHGQNAEKAALGKSKVIKGWEASKVVKALKGYKDGTYGGVMKGVMTGQVNNLSDEEVDALGAYVSSL